MTKTLRVLLVASAAAVLFLAPSSFADTASMSLTGAGTSSMAGVMIGPYTANINGVSTQVICDDYADESYVPETWTADVSSASNTGATRNTTKLGLTSAQQTQDYAEAAVLTLQLLAAPKGSALAGEIQFAIWGVFDPQAITDLTNSNSTYGGLAQGDLTGAQSYVSGLSAAQIAALLSQFTIYSPDSSYAISCGGAACQNTPPQEFIVYTPEPSTVLLFGLGLAGLFLLKRRQKLPSLS